jgi:phytoene dehydrogenase-like protein
MRTANIIGSGPNGLAAAITLAQRGVRVTVYERSARPGGACASGEVTLPGFVHDLGSSVYPLGVASPFFRSLRLEEHGLRWVQPPAALAHPFDNGRSASLESSLDATADHFAALNTADGDHDAHAWRSLLASTVREWPQLTAAIMQPLLRVPLAPVALATFGSAALWPAETLARRIFRTAQARALFAGAAAHTVLPLSYAGTSAAALVLIAAAHTTGWPIAAGGAQSIADALLSCLSSLGGTVVTGVHVRSLADLPPADITLFDTSVDALRAIARHQLSPSFDRRLQAQQRGAGIFKLDYALSSPIPWSDAACLRAATVHLGNSLEEIVASEAASCTLAPHAALRTHAQPFIILVQPSLFDETRAPHDAQGLPQHTAWAYCHVPNGSTEDMTDRIEAQITRFAPGFRNVVLTRKASNTAALEAWNPNLVGGDVSAGAMTLAQQIARPTLRQYRTSNAALYLCSAATSPGGGVHGMCGYNAANAALQDHHRR